MRDEDVISWVQQRARLPGRDEAASATRATLEVLAGHLDRELTGAVAASLPSRLGRHLPARATRKLDAEEFWQQVSEREVGTSPAEAAFHVRAVLSVLRDGLDPDLFDEVREQLPREFRAMLCYCCEDDRMTARLVGH